MALVWVEEKAEEFSFIGKSLGRIDAAEKVAGLTRYAYDLYLPGALSGAIVTSKYAHARIKSIDISGALSIPGVRAVITSRDVPKKRKGQLFFDRPVITDKARYVGDVIAAVAADTEEVAYEAARRIKVEYEVLPAVFDVLEAYSKEPVAVIHEEIDDLIKASLGHPLLEQEKPFIQEREHDRPNVFATFKGEVGEVDKAFEEADEVVENEFRTGRAYQAPLEPHIAIADYNPVTGEAVIWSSCQAPYRQKLELCWVFDLDPAKVTIINPPVGGGFGSKVYLTIEDIALALSMKARRPVRLAYTRRDDFISVTIRNASYSRVRDAIKDGRIVAREIEVLFDGGAYNDATFKFVTSAIFSAAAAYKIPNFRFRCYGVYTNTPVGGAMRGFGVPQVLWAVERQMDLVAERLGIDPVDLRAAHLPSSGDPNPISGESMDDIKPSECLRAVIEAMNYHELRRKPREEGKWRRGIGIAMGVKPIHLHHPSAIVRINPNATVEVRVGVQEIGTGSLTALAQIAAEYLKTPLEKIKVLYGDTRFTPYDEGAAGSRVTSLTGNAVLLACKRVKEQVLEAASSRLGAESRDLDYEDGYVFQKSSPSRRIHVSELYYWSMYGLPTAAVDRGEMTASAVYDLKRMTRGARRLHQSWTWGAQGIALAVNMETGRVRIDRVVTAIDVGRAINPELVKSQIEGGVAQALGLTLYEELVLSGKGEVVNENFLDYKIPTPLELPLEIETIIIESRDSWGPYGAKAVGEFPIVITSQTVAAALYDAIGVQFKEYPITSEKIFNALKGWRDIS